MRKLGRLLPCSSHERFSGHIDPVSATHPLLIALAWYVGVTAAAVLFGSDVALAWLIAIASGMLVFRMDV